MKFFYFFLLTFLLPGAALPQSDSLLNEIRNHQEGIGLWWAGHNSWLIKSGDRLVATDLYLESNNRLFPVPISTTQLASELDVSFITHAHDDHFNRRTTEILLELSDCMFVMPESCLPKAREIGIPAERIQVAIPKEPFELMGLKVSPIRAIHGNANFAIYYEANLQDCGYLIDMEGTTFLQPGDSYLLEDHLFLKHVDVLFFSPTEHNTYIDRSVILINTLNPDFIFPQHHSTMKYDEANRFWAKGYPAEVRIRLSQELQNRYHILGGGDYVKIR